MDVPGIYAIVNLGSGRRYVGSSNRVTRRWNEHVCDLRHNRHTAEALQNDWNTLGPDAFGFVLLEELSNQAERIEREQFHIDNTPDIYNASRRAGSGPRDGFRHKPETRAKLAAFGLSRRGYKQTEETRARISAARKGRTYPRHAAALRGRKLSPETRAKMSAARKGIVRTPEWRAHLSAALTGRKFTPEWCARISEAKRGRRRSQTPDSTLVVSQTTLLASVAESATPLT